jgi:hypothetical protein
MLLFGEVVASIMFLMGAEAWQYATIAIGATLASLVVMGRLVAILSRQRGMSWWQVVILPFRHTAAGTSRRLRPLELRLAFVTAIAMGIAWATITGAHASVAGRVGYFLIGMPIGAAAGLRAGESYLDGGMLARWFLRVIGVAFGLLTIAAVVRAVFD